MAETFGPRTGPEESAAEEGLLFLAPKIESEGFPWLQIWGYIGSLVLTFGAFGLVVYHLMTPLMLLVVILTLAVGQAALQLGVFMHLREARGPAWQIVPLGLAFFIALGMVGMSIWIMLFKSGVS
jgi:cytochrome aa3 quinol oxidase subunit IV